MNHRRIAVAVGLSVVVLLGVGVNAAMSEDRPFLREPRTEAEGNPFAAHGIECGKGRGAGISNRFGEAGEAPGFRSPEEAAISEVNLQPDAEASILGTPPILVETIRDPELTVTEIRKYAFPDETGAPAFVVFVTQLPDGTWFVERSAWCVEDPPATGPTP